MDGRQALENALADLLRTKQDVTVLIPALAGRYDVNGKKQISVPGKQSFVYVRVHGIQDEVWEVYNDIMGLSFGTPVYITKDITNPRQFKIYGRNGTIDQAGSEDTSTAKHGRTHSADTTDMVNKDPVWIYRRQMVQPLLCQPSSPASMTVYVNPDYYSWKNNFVYFGGGSSTSLTSYKPAAGKAKYVTIYLEGDTNTIKIQDTVDVFDATYPPSSVVTYIPEVNSGVGIPLAAIRLTYSTVAINWADMIDLRIMLYTSTGSNSVPVGSGAAVSSVASSGVIGSTGYVSDAGHTHPLAVTSPISWSGSTIGIEDAAINLSKLQEIDPSSLLGNATGATGAVAPISLGSSMQFSSGVLQTADAVTLAGADYLTLSNQQITAGSVVEILAVEPSVTYVGKLWLDIS